MNGNYTSNGMNGDHTSNGMNGDHSSNNNKNISSDILSQTSNIDPDVNTDGFIQRSGFKK